MMIGPVLTYEQALQEHYKTAQFTNSLAKAGKRRSVAELPSFKMPGPKRPVLHHCTELPSRGRGG
eukprot:5365743-Karenia_brevis.AAC.1